MVLAGILAALAAATPPAGAPPAPVGPATSAPGQPQAFATISGPPPEPPLRRTDPRLWEARIDASLWAPSMRRGDTQTLQLRNIMIWVPVVVQSTWSQVDPGTIRTDIWVQGERDPSPADRTTFRQGLANGTAAVGIAIPEVSGQSLKWSVRWSEQCWSAVADDAAAARITWPAEWPPEVRANLEAQPGIEAGHDDFRRFVDKVSGGQLRQVTPWVAAKELVRATINAFTALDADGIRVENGFPRGIVLNGAWAAMQSGKGTCHDLAAACVAVLRTAGIPARVVLGITEVDGPGGGAGRTRFVTWCEFWLPGAGWVPFSPSDLRGAARGGLAVERPWPCFGTWDDLNRRLPICYGFSAPVPGAKAMPYPCGYAWSAHGTIDLTQASDSVTLQVTGRGRVRE